jgi:hypothetical protein
VVFLHRDGARGSGPWSSARVVADTWARAGAIRPWLGEVLSGSGRDSSNWYADNRFAIPLWLGILGLVMLIFPVQARNGHGAADLTPRTVVSFARGWWFVTPAVVGAFILILTFAAGPVSVSEEEPGRFDMYYVDLGGGRGMGTSIYGWFYSVPALILTGLLIAIAVTVSEICATGPCALAMSS